MSEITINLKFFIITIILYRVFRSLSRFSWYRVIQLDGVTNSVEDPLGFEIGEVKQETTIDRLQNSVNGLADYLTNWRSKDAEKDKLHLVKFLEYIEQDIKDIKDEFLS